MTTLQTKNFATLAAEWAAVAQASVAATNPTLLLSTSQGSILRAFAEAQGSVSLWLQGLVLKVLSAVRLATSQGPDVDSFIADFGLIRLPAQAAVGIVTFARATPTNPAVIPVGALVQTADGSQTFAVIANPSFGSYTAGVGYTIPASVASLQVPVQAVAPGAAGNVQAGSITIIQTGISGVDTVVNATAFLSGYDAESDAAVRLRFVNFIASLAKGTDGALTYAAQSVQQGIQVRVLNNEDANGQTDYGMVTVFIDDGSGATPAATVAAVNAAVQPVRAAGIRVGVYAATMLQAFPVMTIVTAPGYYHPTVVGQVAAAIAAYVNGLGLGNTLGYFDLAAVAKGVTGVLRVENYSLNGAGSDLVPGAGQTIKAGAVAVA